MPLVPPTLKTQLQSLFSGPGATDAACATSWANAVGAYAAAVVPASSAVATAKATLATTLAGAFSGIDASVTAAAMEVAFTAFATTVGAAMAGFVATPPTGAVGFADLFTPPFEETHSGAAQAFADAVDAWMKTGTAVPVGGGASVDWS